MEDDYLVSLATIDLLESIGCEVVVSPRRLSAAVQIAKSEILDAAVLDTTLAGEMVWPAAMELLRRGVPSAFLSVMSHTMFPDRLAHALRLSRPLDQRRLERYFQKLWGEGQTVRLSETATQPHLAH